MSALGEIRSKGQVVAGRYRLAERLGEGGMGVVWRAIRVEDGEHVAIKLIKSASTSRSTIRRVGREARAAGAVVHPNVVRVHEVISVDGRPGIVMELCVGETLAGRLERGPLSTDEAATILIRIAGAVGAAHARGIVHRDLKPANVFLVHGPDGDDVKVLDFGLAKWTRAQSGSADTAATASGALLGTPAWMSPEQAFGERDIDHRTDLWSLGIIAYQCLSGVLPTRAENFGQVLKIVLQSRILPLADVAREVPADLAALVDALLRPERDDRPADMRDVARRLEPHTPVRVPIFGAPDASPRAMTDGNEDEAPAEDEAATLDPSAPPSPRARSDAAVRLPPRRGRRAGAIVAACIPFALAAVIALALRSPGPARSPVDTAGISPPGDSSATAAVSPQRDVAAPAAAPGDVADVPANVERPKVATLPSASRAPDRASPQATSSPARTSVTSARPPASTQPTAAAPAPPPPTDAQWPTEFGP